MTKSEQIADLMLQRLEAAFPAATVKHGWAETYWQQAEQWPLVTIAPAASDQTYDGGGTAGINRASWNIYIMDQVERTETEVSKRLMQYLATTRKALIAKRSDERHNQYGGLLTQAPTEPAAARFIQPDSGLPFAGLVLTITTPYTEKLE